MEFGTNLGDVAQLGERGVRNAEARSSILLISTNVFNNKRRACACLLFSVMGLDIAIFSDAPNEADREYEGTDVSFAIEEWAAFFDELEVPTPPYMYGDDMAEHLRRAKEMFQAALSDFPMLSRMEDYYSDAEYNSQEVHQLLNECNSVLPKLTNPDAITFANGLISGCKEAIKSNSGLSLGAD